MAAQDLKNYADSLIDELAEGIRIKDNKFIFDYDEDRYLDLIYLLDADFYEDRVFNNVYWFGYRFTDEASRKDRSNFISYIKGLSEEKPSDKELSRFINKPLIKLHERENITSINCIIYPSSKISQLVNKIVRAINDVTSRSAERLTIELIKSLPQNISFNWNMFNSENDYYRQQQMFIDSELMPKINKLDYFSIAHNVKPKYRKYIQNFLTFKSDEDKSLFSYIQAGKVLIVDDINTSGSTINEILRMLNEINSDCKIYIYTLIGK